MKEKKDTLFNLIEIASLSGLSDFDVKNAKDFLFHSEYGLCFDTVITQMYEYDIKVNIDFYNLVCKIGEKMNLEYESYSFIKELIMKPSEH